MQVIAKAGVLVLTIEGGIFDIIGPVMIGPSSSHTAGAVRLGLMARNIFGEQPDKVEIVLHGSFAFTGRGHGTDRALVAGLLGWAPDDTRLPQSLKTAAELGMQVEFFSADLGEVHPNTALLRLEKGKNKLEILGSSIGGGKILTTKINDFQVELSGSYAALIIAHRDRPGVVASVTSIVADHKINISAMRVSRQSRGARAMMIIEMDQLPPEGIVSEILGCQSVEHALLLKPITTLGGDKIGQNN